MGTFTMDRAGVLAFLIAFGLPVLVGLVTTRVTSSALKAWLLLALSAVGQFVAAVAQPGSFSWKTAVWSALLSFVISVAIHFGLWKPTGVSDAATDTGVTSSR
jgi:hypothetical protein